ncbi:Pc22g21290 [Penicillium rubens Wisconsin 54-1255]|uniref:Copper transport protein n=1 Tax=Penicillium rubens (strain ATCC 28089 / DSM 1075 / NRRL 1951 / Wisconsin 54-1255) TaxID=500485 RepID=B6HSG5_PENRW|nr:Pc22g21290 [Penicillium rubens Wisconsin 54-1255]
MSAFELIRSSDELNSSFIQNPKGKGHIIFSGLVTSYGLSYSCPSPRWSNTIAVDLIIDSDSHSHSNEHPSATMNKDMNMPAVFSASTEITILFTGWTTSTTTQYIFTLTFLFILAIFNRFLGALKFQLERSWSQNTSPPILLLAPVNPRQNIRKAKLSPLPDYMRVHGDEDEEETLPVSNNNETRSTTTRSLKRDGPRKRMSLTCMLPSWKASGTWSLRKDGTRALLECVRALIGYFL